jgi:hypothetical protein
MGRFEDTLLIAGEPELWLGANGSPSTPR